MPVHLVFQFRCNVVVGAGSRLGLRLEGAVFGLGARRDRSHVGRAGGRTLRGVRAVGNRLAAARRGDGRLDIGRRGNHGFDAVACRRLRRGRRLQCGLAPRQLPACRRTGQHGRAGGLLVDRAIVVVRVARPVQALHHALQRVHEAVAGGEHVTQVQQVAAVLAHMRHAQHTAEDLLHVDRRSLVGERRQDVGERAVPAFLERIDGDDVAHRAVAARQVDALQLVDGGGLDADLLGRHLPRDELLANLLERGVVVCRARLRLEQHDRADVAAAGGLLLHRQVFKPAAQDQRRLHHLLFAAAIGDDHRQLDHVLALERQRVDEADDVAVVARRGGQVEDEVGVQVPQHLDRQLALGVVAFIDHHHRPQPPDDVDQRGRIMLGQQPVGRVAGIGPQERRQIAVLLIDLAVFLVLRAQRIEAHDDDRQLLARRVVREARARQQVAFLVHHNAVPEQLVEPPAVRMRGAAQRFDGLFEDGQRRHQPHHQLRPLRVAPAERVEDGGERVHGDEGLAARRRHLGAEMRHAGHGVLVRLHAALRAVAAHPHALAGPVVPERLRQVRAAVELVEVAGQVGEHARLVVLQFHAGASGAGVSSASRVSGAMSWPFGQVTAPYSMPTRRK